MRQLWTSKLHSSHCTSPCHHGLRLVAFTMEQNGQQSTRPDLCPNHLLFLMWALYFCGCFQHDMGSLPMIYAKPESESESESPMSEFCFETLVVLSNDASQSICSELLTIYAVAHLNQKPNTITIFYNLCLDLETEETC